MLSPEQLEIQALAREFATAEIRPRSAEWDAARALPDAIVRQLAELGFLGLRVPEAHGGLGLDATTTFLALEALAWGDASLALTVAVHTGPVTRALARWGDEEQKARWLPALASGETLGAFALSEAGAGSDPGGLELEAAPAGDGWRLNGAKRWVTNGGRAGLVVLFARTGPGRPGITAFLVDRGAGGIEVTSRERTLGLAASETVGLAFTDVSVGSDAVLGGVGRGWEVARDALVFGRLGISALALGIAGAAYEHALAYAIDRRQFGRALAEFGAIQEKLAGMAIRIAGSRALASEVAVRADREETGDGSRAADRAPRAEPSLEAAAAMAKVSASETAMWVADEAVQVFGGYGYMRDYPVEKLMRDAKGTEITEGANEVLRWIVAREAIRTDSER